MEELTSSEYCLRLTDHTTYGIVTIKSLFRGENKEKIARPEVWRSWKIVYTTADVQVASH